MVWILQNVFPGRPLRGWGRQGPRQGHAGRGCRLAGDRVGAICQCLPVRGIYGERTTLFSSGGLDVGVICHPQTVRIFRKLLGVRVGVMALGWVQVGVGSSSDQSTLYFQTYSWLSSQRVVSSLTLLTFPVRLFFFFWVSLIGRMSHWTAFAPRNRPAVWFRLPVSQLPVFWPVFHVCLKLS